MRLINFSTHYSKLNLAVRCEIFPSTVLKLKWLAQRTHVRFRCHFTFALLTKKFLGGKCGVGA